MTDPAVEPATPRGRGPKALFGLAGLACLACCLVPFLIAAGVLGGGAAFIVGWLPAIAVALAVLAAGLWWLQYRRAHARPCSCRTRSTKAESSGCSCGSSRTPVTLNPPR
jgi:hypothetical protein